MDTDKDWEFFGQRDPYWGVLSHDRFRGKQLDEAALKEFFESGRREIEAMLATIRHQLHADFSPVRALDFGCGVGRLSLALAGICKAAVGIDISESMLLEGRLNARRRQLANVEFVKGDDRLSRISGAFDLVVSYIVLQHIPCERGQRIFEKLVDLVAAGGVGVLHLTYSKARFNAAPFDAWPRSAASFSTAPLREFTRFTVATAKACQRKLLAFFKGLLRRQPRMQMNPYLLNPLFHLLQRRGISEVHIEFTDHSGQYGMRIFFQKPRAHAARAA